MPLKIEKVMHNKVKILTMDSDWTYLRFSKLQKVAFKYYIGG